MLSFLINNISHMIPILACLVLAAAIIFDRARMLYIVYPMRAAAAFFDSIRNLVMADRLAEAIALCDRYKQKPVAFVVKHGLMRAHQPQEIIENGLEVAVGEAVDRVRARTGYLSMIANVATLLGLIGTILGLIKSFEAVGAASAQERSGMLAQGISMAMNHTLWGLSVAVPCMVIFSFFMNRTNRLKGELDRAAVRTMDILQQRYVHSVESPRGGDRTQVRRAL